MMNEIISLADRDESQIASAPSEMQVHADYESIKVSWLPPRDENIMIRGFQIGWGINVPDIEKAVVDSRARQYTIRGLKPNREYVISLRAFNNIGHGFPIYETVKTYSYGMTTVSLSRNFESLLVPVGLFAETLSVSQIRLSWADPNEQAFNQLYTIRHGISSESKELFKELNTSETEYLFNGLMPDTQYEFSVKIANTQQWSLTALNRTFPAPPSSPPRNLMVTGPQSLGDDQSAVTLKWQTPKYANGEIREYIILYSNKLDAPESDWMLESVSGDKLSLLLRNLKPLTAYYFKLQAKNLKGFGPFTPVVRFETPENAKFFNSNQLDKNLQIGADHNQNATFYQQIFTMFSENNITNIFLGAITIILLVVLIAFFVACAHRRPSRQRMNNEAAKYTQYSYTSGRKQQSQQASDNCNNSSRWMQQSGARFAAVMDNSGTIGRIPDEIFEMPTAYDDGERRVIVDRQQRVLVSSEVKNNIDSLAPRYYSQYLPEPNDMFHNCYNNNTAIICPQGRVQGGPPAHVTPTTPRNPHVLYSRADIQPIPRVDLRAEQMQQQQQPPSHNEDCGMSIIMGTTKADDINCSYQMPSGVERMLQTNDHHSLHHRLAPESLHPSHKNHSQQQPHFKSSPRGEVEKRQHHCPPPKIAHIVRPIVSSGKPANAASPSVFRSALQSNKSDNTGNKLPVGRAAAQPRVNLANSSTTTDHQHPSTTSPYSSIRVHKDLNRVENSNEGFDAAQQQQQHRLHPSNDKSIDSADELNVQEIDQMIDTLQQLQHEFTKSEDE